MTSRVDPILDLIDGALADPGQHSPESDLYTDVAPAMPTAGTCWRCTTHPTADGSELCAGCRSYLLEDTEDDPTRSPAVRQERHGTALPPEPSTLRTLLEAQRDGQPRQLRLSMLGDRAIGFLGDRLIQASHVVIEQTSEPPRHSLWGPPCDLPSTDMFLTIDGHRFRAEPDPAGVLTTAESRERGGRTFQRLTATVIADPITFSWAGGDTFTVAASWGNPAPAPAPTHGADLADIDFSAVSAAMGSFGATLAETADRVVGIFSNVAADPRSRGIDIETLAQHLDGQSGDIESWDDLISLTTALAQAIPAGLRERNPIHLTYAQASDVARTMPIYLAAQHGGPPPALFGFPLLVDDPPDDEPPDAITIHSWTGESREYELDLTGAIVPGSATVPNRHHEVRREMELHFTPFNGDTCEGTPEPTTDGFRFAPQGHR